MKVDKSLWQKCQLADICTNATSNITISKIEVGNGDYPLFGANGIVGNINFYHQDKEYIGIVKDGSGVGRVNKYPSNSSLVGTLQYIFPKENISIDFLKYLLISLNLAKYVKGAAIPHIYFRHYKLEKILLPLESEQKTIASELDALQKVINGYKAQIIDLDVLAQSFFLDTFGDPISNPKGWEVKKISEFGKVSTGNTPSRSNLDFYSSKDIEWIKSDNIVKDCLHPTRAVEYLSLTGAQKGRVVKQNSILICCIAGSLQSIGRCCITDRSVAFNQQINAIECNENYHPLYIYWLVRSAHQLFMDAASTGMKHILSKSDMSEIKLPTSTIELQQEFAHKVVTIEQQKELLRQQLADAEMLMAERMQYYFS